jgi:predicted nicotinamide N-methyase
MKNLNKVDEIVVPVGNLLIRILAPRNQEDTGSRITFWWGVTSSAIALARYIESNEDEFADKRVLELGCGLGLAGITAGLVGSKVMFTDYVPQALEFTEKNALLNNIKDDDFRTSILDWDHPAIQEQFDVIFGSEIVYDYFFHGSLIRLLKRILKPNGRVLIADRKRLCVSRFIGRMIAAGFDCSEMIDRVVLSGFPDQEISIFNMR